MNNYVIPSSKRTFTSNNTSLQERSNKNNMMRESYSKFVDSIQPILLSEAMNNMLQKCLDENTSLADRNYGKVLCEQFVKENNAWSMIRRFKTKSVLLAEMAICIKEAANKIIDHTDKNSLNFTIKTSDKNDFYRTLDNLSMDEVCKKINKRVCDATEEFVQNNVNDKLDMEELANKTKEKIDAVKASSEEKEAEIKQEHANIYREAVDNIAYGYNRKRNIYEQMVNTATKTIVKNKDSYGAFINESGKLDVEQITNKVTVMYTFLEMINTAKIQDVDIKYIQECINSIK